MQNPDLTETLPLGHKAIEELGRMKGVAGDPYHGSDDRGGAARDRQRPEGEVQGTHHAGYRIFPPAQKEFSSIGDIVRARVVMYLQVALIRSITHRVFDDTPVEQNTGQRTYAAEEDDRPLRLIW